MKDLTMNAKKGFFRSLFSSKKNEQAVENIEENAKVALEQEIQAEQKEQIIEEISEVVEDINEESKEQAVIISQEIAENASEVIEDNASVEDSQPQKIEEKEEKKAGFFKRLISGLSKTKQNIGDGFLTFFKGKKIDDELFEELEEQLLIADLGVETTTKIIDNLVEHSSRKELKDASALYDKLKAELSDILKNVSKPLEIKTENNEPFVILMVGVNGVGKTTTIGKLAKQFQEQGKSVMLAAGDTFRAAAVEQLQVWGERNNIPVVAQATGSDSASVIFDALCSAKAKGVDVLIADTAGRLQNKDHLMNELKKIVRVMKKHNENAPHEIMLTLDAGTGQNALSQAKLFNEVAPISGICLSKMDGTAKGGVIFAIANQMNIPIRYIGVGEKIEDLQEFNSEQFINALFSE